MGGSLGKKGGKYSEDGIRRKYEKMPRLNRDQKDLLKASWDVIKTKVNKVGARTFLDLFTAHPDSKEMFPKFAGHDVAMLVHSEIILQHGEKVMGAVDRVMESIDSDENIWEILLQIGRMHFHNGAMPTYFEMMGPHFVSAAQQTMGESWRKDLERHWLQFFNMFSYSMNFGWNLQCAEVKQREKDSKKRTSVGSGGGAEADAQRTQGEAQS